MSTTKRVLLFLECALIVVIAAFPFWHQYRWRERPDPITAVALEVRPLRQVIKDGQRPRILVVLVNRGNKQVTLVEPGDGSHCGWRTPLVEWSNDPWIHGARCGNINSLTSSEVFVLRPGERKTLSDWVGTPKLYGSGRYSVSLKYTNIADHEFFGMPLGDHEPSALRLMRRSTNIVAVSNRFEIVVRK